MMTFSINTGTITQADRLNLMGTTSSNLDDVLNILADNDLGDISPRSIRNAIFTSWSSSAFKETVAGSTAYIGIDALNETALDNDIKSKILISKRSFHGTYSYSQSYDLMTSTLLESDVDIFLWNTKSDLTDNSRTRISILSGTNSGIYYLSPYLQSQMIGGTTESLSFDIVNPSGTVSIYGDYGTVSINNITFATKSNLMLESDTDEKVLLWDNTNRELNWGDISASMSSIGQTSSTLNIFSREINVNDYSLEFLSTEGATVNIGDIKIGTTFNSDPLSDVIRRVIYTYFPPDCQLNILPPYTLGYVEFGTSPNIELEYIIHKKTLSTDVTRLINMTPSSYPIISNDLYTMVTSTATGIYISPLNQTQSFTINVSDGTQSNSKSVSIYPVYPYFYGFSNLNVMESYELSVLTKVIEPYGDKNAYVSGSGILYYIYDDDYPQLSTILDNWGNTITASFSYSRVLLSSPDGFWSSKYFKIYQLDDIYTTSDSVTYQFQY